MPSLRVTVYLGVMAIKWYFSFPKGPTLLAPHYQIV